MLPSGGFLADQVEILDMEGVAVELAGEGMGPGREDGLHAAVPGRRREAHGHEPGNPFEIDVVQ